MGVRSLVCVTCLVLGSGCDGTSGAAATTDTDGGQGASGADAATYQSPCTVTPARIECTYATRAIPVTGGTRDVHYALPIGTPPVGGWPTVVFYQGSFVSAELTFAIDAGAPFGGYQLAATVDALLRAGYAVLAPEALGGGSTAWQTNIPPYATSWSGSADDVFVEAILAAIESGDFGPLDASELFAMGISSGGFMSSRMAVSYPGRFRALGIHSASYATCSALCVLPSSLPTDHPPTLILFGEQDAVVPVGTGTAYRDLIIAKGHEAEMIVNPTAGHEWIPAAIVALPAWFARWR